jgi:hypothetical protein
VLDGVVVEPDGDSFVFLGGRDHDRCRFDPVGVQEDQIRPEGRPHLFVGLGAKASLGA